MDTASSAQPIRYYEPEPRVCYQEIKRLGLTCWNELHGEAGFDFSLRDFLQRMLSTVARPQPARAGEPRRRALEIGCGTGPCCCFLAQRGYSVVGVDIEPLAIEMASEFAAQRNLQIAYRVGDICRMGAVGNAPPTIDLVVDGHCLECIVLDHDRQAVLRAVRSMLKPDGYFVIGTTVVDQTRDYGDSLDPDTGIVYVSIGDSDPQAFEHATRRPTGWAIPNRRHRTPDQLRTELELAGFDILEQEGGNLCCRLQQAPH